MDKSLENHRRELIRQAIELWEERGEFHDIEQDPVVQLLFSALAYQSHTILQEIASFQEMTVNEFRNKLIPYYLIKPFPAYSIVHTKISENTKGRIEPLITFLVDEKCTFEFGKAKIPFTPLFNINILNATIDGQQVNNQDHTIEFTLTSKNVIEDFAGAAFYFEGIDDHFDLEITMDNQVLPLIKPDDYDNLPFSDWFQNHLITTGENQLQLGSYDYWQELYLKHHFQLFIINDYNTAQLSNRSLTPVFKFQFKNMLHWEQLRDCTIKINCIPVVNVQKNTVNLTDDEPVKKLSTDNTAFLNLLFDKNTENNIDDFIIRHFGIERYSQKELLFQLNDLFNRYVSDYYAFKEIDELKKGDKLEAIYRTFKELLPVIKKSNIDLHPSVYAILKLGDKLIRPVDKVEINYTTTHGVFANGIKRGEKTVAVTNFLDKNNTFLLLDTVGGRNEERNEDNLNHLARYHCLTKDKLITASDLKVFCYRELQQKIRKVSVDNTGEKIVLTIRLKDEFIPREASDLTDFAKLIQHKIKVRSLFSIPVHVVITG